MKRLTVKSWYMHGWMTLHHTSGVKKRLAYYTPNDYDNEVWCLRRKQALGLKGIDDITKIALYVGAYSKLWIGTLDGVLTPMDVPPEGWSFASGECVEPSWFWQWNPSERSTEKLLEDLTRTNPLDFDDSCQIFKNLVPHNMQKKRGAVADIQAINLVELPNLIQPGIDFVFESNLHS